MRKTGTIDVPVYSLHYFIPFLLPNSLYAISTATTDTIISINAASLPTVIRRTPINILAIANPIISKPAYKEYVLSSFGTAESLDLIELLSLVIISLNPYTMHTTAIRIGMPINSMLFPIPRVLTS